MVVIPTEAQVGTHSLVDRLLGHLHRSSLCLRAAGSLSAVDPHLLWGANPWASARGWWVLSCVEMVPALMADIFVFNILTGKHRSSRVKDVAAAVHRKLQTFMEITLEEDSKER